MSPTGIDESWGRADWDALKAAGVQVVSLYLSNDPSKNAKPADLDNAHRREMGVILNWEAQAGAPLLGAGQGATDARTWTQQKNALAKAVGYTPGAPLGAYFSCDRDTTSANYPQIDAYYGATRSIVHDDGSLNGAYGEFDLIEHLAKAGLIDVAWQTLAWSNGRISKSADFYQSSINNTLGGASVDFDQVIHPTQLGAWWPPGSPYDTGGLSVADINSLTKQIADLAADVKWTREWVYGPMYWGDKTHGNALNPQGNAVAQVLTRVAALQSAVADLTKQVQALQAHVQINPASVPVTGTVTIGGTQ